jgi:DNA-binding NtrC family response regulator
MERLQLLIVDDDEDIVDLLATSMTRLGGVAITANTNSIKAAMELLRTRHVDLVLSEVLLSDVSGFDLAKDAANRHVPLLLIPGHPDDQWTCKDCGHPHLDKPFSMAALARALPMAIRDTKQIIERIHLSHARLTVTREHRAALVCEARQLRSESRRLQSESAAFRRQYSHASVNYGLGTSNSRCSLCRHYVHWRGDVAVRCNRVAGPINPGGLCKLFARPR